MTISIDEADQHDMGAFMQQAARFFQNVIVTGSLNPVEILTRDAILTGTLQAAKPICSRGYCRPAIVDFVKRAVASCMRETDFGVLRFHDEGKCKACPNGTRRTFQNREVCLFCLEARAVTYQRQYPKK